MLEDRNRGKLLARTLLAWTALAPVAGCSEPAPGPRASPQATEHDARAPSASDELPIRWTTHLDLRATDLARADALLDLPVDIHTDEPLILELDGKTASPKTGREWLTLNEAGYAPMNGFDMRKESWFIGRALPLRLLARARPARVSFVRDLELERDPLSLLPPELGYLPAGEDEPRRPARRTWKAWWPESTFRARGPQDIEIDDHDGGTTDLSLLAWADFDGDGVEDVLLSVASYATEGTYCSYACVVLTRTDADRPLTVRRVD